MSFQAAGGKGGEEDGSAWYLTTLVCTCQCYHSSSESWKFLAAAFTVSQAMVEWHVVGRDDR
ncbi:hypothetical protein C0Q70_01903 [Pomacea canaliculata]|uniref:Uncharacterized protein n=1 Tax=Pomacea canaliculata TaxID=400727 RepID=A0A2T7Q0S3_POMCA|nr:hypothetical protein C0Q70_01903 [Pomacea canaliculata]